MRLLTQINYLTGIGLNITNMKISLSEHNTHENRSIRLFISGPRIVLSNEDNAERVMGLIRLVLIIAAIWLVWRLIKQILLTNNPANPDEKPSGSKAAQGNEKVEAMVQCQQCGVHLPQSEALVTQNQHFCSDDHRRQWQINHDEK